VRSGHVVVVDRRRDGDHEEGAALQVGGSLVMQRRGLQDLGGLLVVAVEAAAKLGDLLGVDVEAHGVLELAREGERDGEADVAQANDDGDIPGRMWGVATTIEKPTCWSARKRATPAAGARTPSSMAATQWQCRSMKPRMRT
jgi:hypothetical protein